jgi:hypothetical protein
LAAAGVAETAKLEASISAARETAIDFLRDARMEILLRVVGGPGRLVASLGRLTGCAGLASVRRAERAAGSQKEELFFARPISPRPPA